MFLSCLLCNHDYEYGVSNVRKILFKRCIYCDYFATYSTHWRKWTRLDGNDPKYNYHSPNEAELYLKEEIKWLG